MYMTKAFERSASNHEPTLFDDVELHHDYGGDDGSDFGHEFPFVRGDAEAQAIIPRMEQGVSVSIEARDLALEAIARLYGRHNQGKGMKKAVTMPVHRRYIEPRYFDVDYVAERAEINGQYTYEQERAILQPLLKERELIEAGFDEADVDLEAKTIMHGIRQELGVDVRTGDRQKNLKRRTKQWRQT